MSPTKSREIPKSLAVLGIAFASAVAVAMVLSSAPAPGTPLAASTRCSGGGGGGGATPTPTPTPTETEDPGPIPDPTIPPNPLESESPTPTPTATATDGPSGGGTRCDSEITIKHDRARQLFSGVVRSDETACKRGRRVQLRLDRSGRDRTVETTTTTRRGRWKAPFPNPRGRKFYAQTPQAKVAGPDGQIVCRAARSRTIRAQNPG